MTSHSRSDHSPNTLLPKEGRATLSEFALAPELIHLNHGSYGAVPRRVQAEQDRLRALVERDPTGFFQNVYPGAVRSAAAVVAGQFGGDASDWTFCENATVAVNSVLASLLLEAGDEILTTSHGYGAVVKAMRLWAERKGASLRIAHIPTIVESEAQVTEAITAAFSDRTRLLVVDHITSPTAIIFPVQAITAAAHSAGIPVLADGAHAPGHLALDVPSIGADWYTGNAHKWFFAPRGCGLLWTTREWQGLTRPAVLSHGTEQGYLAAFDWVGTRDATPWLSIAEAFDAHADFGGRDLMARNRNLASEGAELVRQSVGGTLSAPKHMTGAMVSICFPAGNDAADVALKLRAALHKEGVVVPAGALQDHIFLRVSAQIYNQLSDYQACADALLKIGFAADALRMPA